MAKKRASKRTAKKKTATKKATTTKKKATARKRAAPALTAAERSSLVRLPANADDLVEQLVRVWKNEGRALRAPGYSAAKLASLLAKASKAAQKDERLRARLEPQLVAATDARLVAQDALWRAVLDVYAMIKAQSRLSPELEPAFAFLTETFARGPRNVAPVEPE